MKRLLVITLLEYKYRPNNRLHHIINSLKKDYDEVYLLYRNMPARQGVFSRFINLIPRLKPVYKEENVSMIEYNPPLNWVEKYDFSHGPERKKDKKGVIIRELSNLFGLLREFLFIVFILFTCLLRARGKKFDVCLVETPWEGISALLLRKLGWVKYVVLDDNDFGPGYMQNKLRRKWEIFLDVFCIRSSDLVICVGSLLADLWRGKTGREIVVIPNGVDLKRFNGKVRRVNRDFPTLVYVGNLSSSWMDFNAVFEAMSSLLERYQNLQFVIAGDEGEKRFQELKSAASDFGILENVDFLGRVSHQEVPDILSKCDIGLVLSPSNQLRKYAFPLKLPEYMAVGLPVIASKGVESEHIVDKYECGLCVGFEVDELKRAIETLIEDEDMYKRCSENGLDGAAHYNIDDLTRIRFETINSGFGKKQRDK
jgi:glycosyltransferase involved in cell wall biosynthesis